MLQKSLNTLSPNVSFETTNVQGSNMYVVRPEISQANYTYRAKGKYTTQIFNNSANVRNTNVQKEFDFENLESIYCNEHEELNEYILFENVDQVHKIYDTICKNCLSELNRTRNRQFHAQLWDAVIFDNKDKIWQIKNNKLNLNNVSYVSEAGNILRDNIVTLADELIYVSESFESDITSKISFNNTKTKQIQKLKDFIGAMRLNANNEPLLDGIGKQEGLKKQYIKLALFLLQFGGIKSDSISQYSLSASLKAHLISIIQLRKLIVLRLTEWLRFLCGNFYEYIFSLEGLEVDYEFIRGLQIEFFSEEEYMKIESKYRLIIDNLRNEYERKLSELNIQNINWTNKYRELEVKYSTDINVYIKQIENYKIQFNELNMQITNYHNRPAKEVTIFIFNLKLLLNLFYCFTFYCC